MGTTYTPVTITALEDGRGEFKADFLVDTGAVDCLAPANELERIGVKRVGRRSYELADGRRVELDYGLVKLEVMGEVTAGRVIFGPDDAEPLLGVTALESAGLCVDPASQQLEKMAVGLLK